MNPSSTSCEYGLPKTVSDNKDRARSGRFGSIVPPSKRKGACKRFPVVFGAFLLVCCGVVSADEPDNKEPVFELKAEHAHGYREGGMNLSEYENVNLANGNLTLNIPLASVATDGGLSYSVNAYYNSKVGVPPGDVGDKPIHYRGVESYGIGWEMRPPRLRAKIGCEHGSSYPECPEMNEEPNRIEYTVHSYVAQSGASHRLISVPPPEWSGIVGDVDSYPEDDPSGDEHCNDSGTSPSGISGYLECPCVAHPGNTQICYTWTEPFVRVTLDATSAPDVPPTATVEDESGVLFRFDHMIDTRALLPYDPQDPDKIYNFREELDGFYITSMERGPWVNNVPQNSISFEYCTDQDDDGLCDGDDVPPLPWLVKNITAGGVNPRQLSFDYGQPTNEGVPVPGLEDMAVIKKLTFPAFSNTTAEVDFSYRFVNADPHLSPDPEEVAKWDAPFLTSITMHPDATSDVNWGFSTESLDTKEVKIRRFMLPTGGTIDYSYQGFPSWRLCSLDYPDQTEDETGRFWHASLYTRTLRMYDVTGTEQAETTAFVRNINCLSGPFEGDTPYPGNPDNPFFPDIKANEGLYYWLWVETYAGDDQPCDDDDPITDTMYTNSNVEIHRFRKKSFREFSVDYFSTISPAARADVLETVYMNPGHYYTGNHSDPVDESFLMNWNHADVTLLRHEQTLLTEDYFTTPCCPYPWEFKHQATEWSKTITNETGSDVRDCAVLAGSGDSCQEVTTELSYGDGEGFFPFLRPLSKNTVVSVAPTGTEANRDTVLTYDTPYILTSLGGVWDLGRRIRSEVSDDASDSVDVLNSNWEFENGYLRLESQWINEASAGDGNWSCDDTTEGCVVTTFGYDDYGNVSRVQTDGGLDEGANAAVPAEVTEYIHGRPFRKKLESDTSEIVLWERGIDPGTGLPRWQIDGAGVGKALGYDALGRMTDVVPIEAAANGSITLQPYEFDNDGNPSSFILGSHYDYFLPEYDPTGTELAWRSVSDSSFGLDDLSNGTLNPGTTGTERAKLYLDGMGRPTQLTEFYLEDPNGTDPLQTNYRTRFSLTYFHDSSGGSSSNPCGFSLADPTVTATARVSRSSEWIDGGDWPGCSSTELHWTTTQFDGLNRPRVQVLPDGSSIETGYSGSSTVTTTRSVATTADEPETGMTTKAVNDAFGRLRRLEEQMAVGEDPDPDTYVVSQYSYDAGDRLRTVVISDDTGSQSRGFEYSDGGFLVSSTEPERYSRFLSYDALGNLLWENTRKEVGQADENSISTTFRYDDFGRLDLKRAGPPGGLKDLGSFAYGSAVGSPNYNKLILTSQSNLFDNLSNPEDPLSATVRHQWTYGSPGGRVRTRTTSVTGNGIGEAGDGFLLEYAYDQWGNRNYIAHPTWTPWAGEDACPSDPFVEQVYTFDGSWLESAALAKDFSYSPAVASVGLKYHENGRVDEAKMYAGTANVATQTEGIDDDGMARPKSISFSASGSTPWEQNNYSYDGSGNIKGFNVEMDGQTGSRSFTYDGLNRLTSFYDESNILEDYAYDAFGNMTDFDGFSIETDPDTNRIENLGGVGGIDIPDSAWDVRGNLTWLPAIPALNDQRQKFFTFSAEDRLMESIDTDPSGPKWRYAYDTSGERVVSWNNDANGVTQEVRITIRDDGGAVLSDWLLTPNTSPASFSRQRDYLYAGGRMIAQVDWGDEPVRRFAAVDHLGSTRYLLPVDSTGEFLEFFPFGGFLEGGETSNTTHLFTGHERDLGLDLSQLDYMHARYYSPNLGRFVSVDPIGGTIGSSQSWNRYAYVENNPVNLTDPTGKVPVIPIIIGVIGGLLGAEWAGTPTGPDDPVMTDPAYQNNGYAMAETTLAGVAVGIAVDQMVSSHEGAPELVPSHDSPTAPQPCFAAGTVIATDSGDRPIEEIVVGDRVWGFDEDAGHIGFYEVTATFVHETDHLRVLSVGGWTIHTTDNHPFWFEGTWQNAEDLDQGGWLTTRGRSLVPVQSSTREEGSFTVYNLEVDQANTYFVSPLSILVHNKANTPRKSSKTIRREWEAEQGEAWPKDESTGRNQDVAHKDALADGGTNDLSNIEPKPHKEHMQEHKDAGDFKRWGARSKKKEE